jgi:hypothetical protein
MVITLSFQCMPTVTARPPVQPTTIPLVRSMPRLPRRLRICPRCHYCHRCSRLSRRPIFLRRVFCRRTCGLHLLAVDVRRRPQAEEEAVLIRRLRLTATMFTTIAVSSVIIELAEVEIAITETSYPTTTAGGTGADTITAATTVTPARDHRTGEDTKTTSSTH